MTRTLTPPTEHLAFDSMCEQVEDFEVLPTVSSASPELAREFENEVQDQAAPLDGLILAGLVNP